jgi:mono/diheme cytochrome c family protein
LGLIDTPRARWFRRLVAIALVSLAASGTAITDEPARSTLDGVFTAAQAERGAVIYTGPCSRCHGYKLDGAPDDPDMLPAPPVAGAKFLRKWSCQSLAALLDYTRATMPENNPGYLSAQQYADTIAYMLSVSGMPAGTEELPGAEQSVLSRVLIRSASAQTTCAAAPLSRGF